MPMEDFGRIATADGRDVYFHRNSILDVDFDQLKIGDEVRYAEEDGEAGPQASSLHLIGKHHIVE
jgi:cold shock CspA family protein